MVDFVKLVFALALIVVVWMLYGAAGYGVAAFFGWSEPGLSGVIGLFLGAVRVMVAALQAYNK